MIKLDRSSPFVKLFCYCIAPRLITQVEGEIHYPCPNLQLVKFEFRRAHALVKFRQYNRVFTDMPWLSFPHTIPTLQRSKLRNEGVLPHNSEDQPLRVSPSKAKGIGDGLDVQYIAMKLTRHHPLLRCPLNAVVLNQQRRLLLGYIKSP